MEEIEALIKKLPANKFQLVLVSGNKIIWEKRHKSIKTDHITQIKRNTCAECLKCILKSDF